MCGRYSQVYQLEQAAKQLDMQLSASEEITPNYNLAPTQQGNVILNEDPHLLQSLRWGLIPAWAKDIKFGARMINARRESIATKPSFRVPIRKKRCLVLADSFYEWRRLGKEKIPYRILRNNDELLVMAGIWDEARIDDRYYRTFSIITTDPNAEMRGIHNRMPVLLLHKEQQQAWLREQPLDETLELLQTPPDGVLRHYRVSQKVNSVRNNGPEMHEPVDEAPPVPH